MEQWVHEKRLSSCSSNSEIQELRIYFLREIFGIYILNTGTAKLNLHNIEVAEILMKDFIFTVAINIQRAPSSWHFCESCYFL